MCLILQFILNKLRTFYKKINFNNYKYCKFNHYMFYFTIYFK